MGLGRKYKIRLASGRVLGPLELELAAKLILKGKVVGQEMAREYPSGEWKEIAQIPELAEILMAKLQGKLTREAVAAVGAAAPVGNTTAVAALPTMVLLEAARTQGGPGAGAASSASGAAAPAPGGDPSEAATRVAPALQIVAPPIGEPASHASIPVPEDGAAAAPGGKEEDDVDGLLAEVDEEIRADEAEAKARGEAPVGAAGGADPAASASEDDDRTTMDVGGEGGDEGEATEAIVMETRLDALRARGRTPDDRRGIQDFTVPAGGSFSLELPVEARPPSRISQEKTIVFLRGGPLQLEWDPRAGMTGGPPQKRKPKGGEWVKILLVGALLGYFAYETYFEEEQRGPDRVFIRPDTLRPRLPNKAAAPDPATSQRLLEEARKVYHLDTVAGYRRAADLLLRSASLNTGNTEALALLASCYLNLIDVSNKDERYFTVISQLIELSRQSSADLLDTVVADVEFYIVVNRPEAAQLRIDEYTKKYPNYSHRLYFYIAQAFLARGDVAKAARFITGYDEKPVFSPRVHYLRGQIAELLGDEESAVHAYRDAIELHPGHAKSRLRIAELMAKRAKYAQAAEQLNFILAPSRLLALSSQAIARAYYLRSQLDSLEHKYDEALHAVERAINVVKPLDPDPDHLLEYYSLRAKVGDAATIQLARREARMYVALSEGESLIRSGNLNEALLKFVEAKSANPSSPAPHVKMGDLFMRQKEINKARLAYEIAAEKAPKSIEIWTKYIHALIQSYEWEKAERAMARFRQMPVPQSAIDKAAGDILAKQERHVEAQAMYRKAMARESIDATVYIAYANSLLATGNYKEAPFFYALALRFDPLNTEAIIGTARAVAGADSIDRAIVILQDELAKTGGNQAELLSAVAELDIQRGEWALAQQYVDQAMAANPDNPNPWRLQARIYLNREGIDRDALDKALDAYKSYSDRNPSDPSGYVERYKLFMKNRAFNKAADELTKIFGVFPKYPRLNYYQGVLYGIAGDHARAVESFKVELKNNPFDVTVMVQLGRELLSECDLSADRKDRVCDVQGAIRVLNQAMGIAPQAPQPKHWLGYANHRAKNYAVAIQLLRAAAGLDSGNPDIFRKLGDVYREVGEAQEAKKAYNRYLEIYPDARDRAEIEAFLRQ